MSQQHFVISVKYKYIDMLKLQGNEDVFKFLKKEISNFEKPGGSCKAETYSS